MYANDASSQQRGLEAKITKWLEQQGYPLEMLVAQALQQADFEVIQSDFYRDIETGESREIDVIAYRYADYSKGYWVQVSCCVECKLAQDKPWIIFKPKIPIGSGLEFETLAWAAPTINSKLGNELLAKILYETAKPEILAMFVVAPIGYGVTQATFQKGKGPDIPYQAVNSVTKAAIAQAINSDAGSDKSRRRTCHVIFPVIVIDGRLFECYLDESGGVVVAEIDSCTLVWRSFKASYRESVTTIFTKAALPKLVQYLSETTDVLMRQAEKHYVLDGEMRQDEKPDDEIPF
jgi:hypothetical protein